MAKKRNKTEETAHFRSIESNALYYINHEGTSGLQLAIEIALHYVKDVTLREDASKK